MSLEPLGQTVRRTGTGWTRLARRPAGRLPAGPARRARAPPWLLDLLATADLPLPVPVTLDLRLDWHVLPFTLGVSVVTGALLGLVPALQCTRPDLADTLRRARAAASPVRSGGPTRWSSRS